MREAAIIAHAEAAARDAAQAVDPWPEGVTDRYLTVANATVDVHEDLGEKHYDRVRGVYSYVGEVQHIVITVTCLGCRDTVKTVGSSSRCPARVDDHDRYRADARYYAQKHAETCRAIVRPTGGDPR